MYTQVHPFSQWTLFKTAAHTFTESSIYLLNTYICNNGSFPNTLKLVHMYNVLGGQLKEEESDHLRQMTS